MQSPTKDKATLTEEIPSRAGSPPTITEERDLCLPIEDTEDPGRPLLPDQSRRGDAM